MREQRGVAYQGVTEQALVGARASGEMFLERHVQMHGLRRFARRILHEDADTAPASFPILIEMWL